MLHDLWRFIIRPIRLPLFIYLVYLVLYQVIRMGNNYVPSFIVAHYQEQWPMELWVGMFAAKFLIFNGINIKLDNILDYHIVVRLLYPMYRHLRWETIGKMLELDEAWHQAQNSGVLIEKINNGMAKVNDLIARITWGILPTTVLAMVSIVTLLITSPLLAPIAAVMMWLFIYLSIKSNSSRAPLRKQRHDHQEKATSLSVEMMQFHTTISVFSQAEVFLRLFVQKLTDVVVNGVREMGIANAFNWNRLWILNAACDSALIILWYQLRIGQISTPTFMFTFTVFLGISTTAWEYANIVDWIFDILEPINRLLAILKAKPILDYSGQYIGKPEKVEVEFRSVTFTYPNSTTDGTSTIRDISFRAQTGQTVAIVGPSGAGKTTIANLLLRFTDPDSGHIVICGVDAREWKKEAYIDLFGYCPSPDFNHMFDDTIRFNFQIGNQQATFSEIEKVANDVRLGSWISSLPKKYETMVGEEGIYLSAGQRQRIGIARVLLKDAKVLILDEPSAQLDQESERAITDVFTQRQPEILFLIIAHRLSTIRRADLILVVDNGRVIEQGNHEELMRNKQWYARMYRDQMGMSEEPDK